MLRRNLLRDGFTGPVWFVNPKYQVIADHPCFPSVAALPRAPDLAVLVTPPQTIPALIGELGEKGTRAAVVITAGIRGDLKQAMLDAARPYTLRVQGPNCVGLMLPRIGLNASFSFAPLAGDIAFLSQSGALITGIVDWARGRNIGFSHVVSLGDMADADFGDLLDYLAGDPQCRAILLYMESVTNAPKFMSAARRAARSKPVIVVKAGRSSSGAKAAQSHTGALAGTDAAYEAAFRRAGVLRVRELDELFSAAEILSRHPRLYGDRLAILTNGGGAGVLATDRLGDLNGSLAELTEATLGALDGVLPPTWSHGNPVDIIGDADAERYRRALEILLGADEADAILVMNCPTALTSSTTIAQAIIGLIEQRRGRPNTETGVRHMARGRRQPRGARGICSPPDRQFRHALGSDRCLHAAGAPCQSAARADAHSPVAPDEIEFDVERAKATIAAALKARRSLLSEVEAKGLLAAYGIPVVPTEIAQSPAEVGRLAERSWPSTTPAWSRSYPMTSRTNPTSAGCGWGCGPARCRARRPRDAEAHRRQAAASPHHRLHGSANDPTRPRPRAHFWHVGRSTFGPLMMFGAGGTAVEVVRDIAHGLPPLDHNLARDMMRQTRVWSLLQGYRDRPPDLAAIADTLVRLSYLIARHPEIRELDINPLLADDEGAIVLDARVAIADARSCRASRWPSGPTLQNGRLRSRCRRSVTSAFALFVPRMSRFMSNSLPRSPRMTAGCGSLGRDQSVARLVGQADPDRLCARNGVCGHW